MLGIKYRKIWKKKCMEEKKFKTECEFIGFKIDRLHYKCKECG